MNLNHKHYRQIVQRHIHLGPLPSHRGLGICCGWNWMEVIQNLKLPNPEMWRIIKSDSVPFVESMCSGAIPPEQHHAGTFLALHFSGIWFEGGGYPAPQALSVSVPYLERLPQLSFRARQDSSYLHSQADLVAETRINLSVQNLQGKGFVLLMKILIICSPAWWNPWCDQSWSLLVKSHSMDMQGNSPCSEGWRIWKAHTYAHLGRWGSERVIGKKRCKIWEKHSGSNWTPDVCLWLAFWGQY